jgi:hypothetical protein
MKHRPALYKNISYRPLRFAKVDTAKTSSLGYSGQPEDETQIYINSSALDPTSNDIEIPVLDLEGIVIQGDNVELYIPPDITL